MKTVKQIAEAADVKTRTVQYWVDNGVLICAPGTRNGGTGTHRRFADEEAGAARIASAMHGMGLGIGTIAAVMGQIRAAKPKLSGPALLVVLFGDAGIWSQIVASPADAMQAMTAANSGACAIIRINATDAQSLHPSETLRAEVGL